MKRRMLVVLVMSVVALVGAAFATGALLFRQRGIPTQQASGGRRILYYRSAMNPQVTSPTPKKDPMGMDFVPVYADEEGSDGAGPAGGAPSGTGPNAVHVSSRVMQETGVTTERAEMRPLSRTVRTVGMVKPDEQRLYSITVKFAGWVDQLYVNFVGDRVKKGAPLASIYSPDLLATQREYLLALRYAQSLGETASPETRAEAEKLLKGARRRLELWDIPKHEIEDLARRGEPNRTMMIHAPASGVVLAKEVTAGSQVQPGMTLLSIADLREVWVFAQIYPYQLPWIRVGQAARIEVPGIPGPTLEGRVNYIQPVVSTEARTVEVRIQVSQPGDGILLKPNMYSNVEIRSPVQQEVIAIGEQAVIRSGERNVAIIALGNGYFEPRDVRLGAAGDGYVEVLDGIKAGEEVVTSSQFLLDSESNLRAALGQLGGGMPGMPGMAPGGDKGRRGERGGSSATEPQPEVKPPQHGPMPVPMPSPAEPTQKRQPPSKSMSGMPGMSPGIEHGGHSGQGGQ